MPDASFDFLNAAHSEVIGGIRCFSPDVAHAGQDYPREAFAKLAAVEDRHFWFQSRNEIIRGLVGNHLGHSSQHSARFLEIGCGTGCVLRALSNLSFLSCLGSEVDLSGAQLAQERVPGVEVIQLDATRLPFREQFDGVGAFDVLEHLDDDLRVIENVWQALKPGGCFFVAVPQHAWLWSQEDEMARHKRRYTRTDLVSKLQHAGFKIERSTSYCFTVFPFMIAERVKQKIFARGRSVAASLEAFDLPHFTNDFLRAFTRCDEWLIQCGVSLPFGGSLMAVARKPTSDVAPPQG